MNLEPIDPKINQGEFLVEINGLKLWCKVSGNGPVCIVPTPGWGVSIEYLLSLRQLEDLFTMVYLETRGTGRSQAPQSTTEYSWDHFTADLDALRQHLQQDQVWLMGHSQGGMLVMHYAFSHPDRVKGLLVIDSAPGFDADMLADAISRADRFGFGDLLAYEFDSQLVHPPDSEADFQKLMAEDQPIFRWHDVKNAEKHKETFASVRIALHPWQGSAHSHQASFDFLPHLASITAPTLIVVGSSDVVCPVTQAVRIHREIPNSKLLVIENSGHFPWLEASGAFFKGVREFLPKLGY